jgi:hypothetical protein
MWNTEMPRYSTRFDVHGRVHFALSQPITHRSHCGYAPSVAVAVKEERRYPVLAPCPAWAAARCMRVDGSPRTRRPSGQDLGDGVWPVLAALLPRTAALKVTALPPSGVPALSGLARPEQRRVVPLAGR